MKSASVASLKSHLSYFLQLVKSGSEVIVTSHRQPVGKLVPYKEDRDFDILPPSRPLQTLLKIKGVKPKEPIDVVRLLRMDRDKR